MRSSTCLCLMVCIFGAVLSEKHHVKGAKKFGITGDAALKLGEDLFRGPYKSKEMEKEIPRIDKGRQTKTAASLRKEHVAEHKAQRENPGRYIEGDIKPSKIIKEIMQNKIVKTRELMESVKWPITKDNDGKPVVKIPFTFDGSLGAKAKDAIIDAFKEYKASTCIEFVTRQAQDDYIKFFKGEGCYSSVGRTRGEQEISIGTDCDLKGTVIHEIMHALGFFHEHTRPDRDEFVTIHFDRIREDMRTNFEKYDHNLVTELNAKYDMLSIMHYNQFAFSKNIGEQTITPKDTNVKGDELGQRFGLTKTDSAQINAAYCDQPIPTTATTTTLLFPTTSTTTLVPPIDPTTSTTTLVPPIDPTTSTTTTLDPDLLKTTTTTLAPGETTKTTTTTTETPTTTTPGPDACGNPPCEQCQQPQCQQQQAGGCPYQAPCWPQDFQWSSTGFPQSCGCGSQQHPKPEENSQNSDEQTEQPKPQDDENDKKCKMCKCLSIKTKRSPKSWANNHFCYKVGKNKDPHFNLLRNGNVPGKRCLLIDDSKEWENLHLCFDKSVPYDLSWSDVDQVSADGKSRCLKMGNQHDWSWGKQKFLCQSPN